MIETFLVQGRKFKVVAPQQAHFCLCWHVHTVLCSWLCDNCCALIGVCTGPVSRWEPELCIFWCLHMCTSSVLLCRGGNVAVLSVYYDVKSAVLHRAWKSGTAVRWCRKRGTLLSLSPPKNILRSPLMGLPRSDNLSAGHLFFFLCSTTLSVSRYISCSNKLSMCLEGEESRKDWLTKCVESLRRPPWPPCTWAVQAVSDAPLASAALYLHGDEDCIQLMCSRTCFLKPKTLVLIEE